MIEDDLSVPHHWPKTVREPEGSDEQSAVKALAEVRRLIVVYRKSADAQDWRTPHAQESHIVNVVGGLIADAKAIDELFAAADRRVRPLEEEVERLRGELAESKRPFTAQMTMQNNRIVALNAEVDRLSGLLRERSQPSNDRS